MESFAIERLRRFNYLAGEINALYHQASMRFSLADSVMDVLYTLCSTEGDCTVGDICRVSALPKQTLNSALRKLEQEGLVYLKNKDERTKFVCLTEQGAALAQATAAKIIQLENEIWAGWSEEEQELYLMLTERYLAGFRQRLDALQP